MILQCEHCGKAFLTHNLNRHQRERCQHDVSKGIPNKKLKLKHYLIQAVWSVIDAINYFQKHSIWTDIKWLTVVVSSPVNRKNLNQLLWVLHNMVLLSFNKHSKQNGYRFSSDKNHINPSEFMEEVKQMCWIFFFKTTIGWKLTQSSLGYTSYLKKIWWIQNL